MGLGRRYPEIMEKQRRIAQAQIAEIQAEQEAADAALAALGIAGTGTNMRIRR
jgi:hypothetical protein